MSDRLTLPMWEPVQAHRALQSTVLSMLRYEPETGHFYWTRPVNGRIKVGQLAGVVDSTGYRRIMVQGKSYMAHHLAWLVVFGQLPTSDMDHINRNRQDNRIDNLREVTRSQNMQNTGTRKDNKSGVRGVYWSAAERKWKAQIRCNGKRLHLGTFAEIEPAAKAVVQARSRLFTHAPMEAA